MQTSVNINELAAALSKAQAVIQTASKDSENPFFRSRYADLASVWDAARQALTDNGLSIVQPASFTDGKVTVDTVLMHSSGQWISERLTLPVTRETKDKGWVPAENPQAIGSTITYARRYGLGAMVGVVADDEDDDGEGAEGRKGKPPARPAPAKTQSMPPKPGCITEEQQKAIYGLAHTHNKSRDACRAIYAKHGFATTADIAVDKFKAVCDEIEAPIV